MIPFLIGGALALVTNKKDENTGLGVANTLDLDYGDIYENENGLGAPRHTGLAKEALTECGRLKPGFKFIKGGEIEKVSTKKNKSKKENPKTKKQVVTKYVIAPDAYLEKVLLAKNAIDKLDEEKKAIREKINEEKEYSEKRKYWERLEEISKEKQAITFAEEKNMNIVRALSQGGTILNITDKKGKEHKEIADFTSISTQNFVFNPETILTDEIPPYIPLFDEKVLMSRGFVFDAIKINDDQYLAATKKHDEAKPTEYVLITLDQLVLISDYFFTRAKAGLARDAKNYTERSLKNWDNLPEEKRKRFYTANSAKALYHNLPAKLKKKITVEKYDNLTWKEKEDFYKFYKRHGSKRITSKLEEKYMFTSLHDMYERFIDPKATKPNPRSANPVVFSYWREFRDLLAFKLIDINIQRQAFAESRKKGMETAFGDSNLNKTLVDKHGILAKRQNGSIINIEELEQIEDTFANIYKTFGNFSNVCRKYGLKFSHTGKTLVYARKAVGIFDPNHKSIAASAKYSFQDFQTTTAHELAHFLDNLTGSIKGKRYESDNYGSKAGKLAFKFRELMNEKVNSDYTNSTKECLARAVEQYFAIENFGNDAIHFYNEMMGAEKKQTRYVDAGSMVSLKNYQDHIKPMVEDFFKDALNQLNENGLGAPRHTGLAKEALTECGRLKPGFKYNKGEIVKIEKSQLPKNEKNEYVWLIQDYKVFKKGERGQIVNVIETKKGFNYKLKLESTKTVTIPEKLVVGFKEKPKTFKFSNENPKPKPPKGEKASKKEISKHRKSAISFVDFDYYLNHSRFYKSGKQSMVELPTGKKIILKNTTEKKYKEDSLSFIKSVYQKEKEAFENLKMRSNIRLLKSIALSVDNESLGFEFTKNLKEIDVETSKDFRKKYNPQGTKTPKQAYSAFYREVKAFPKKPDNNQLALFGGKLKKKAKKRDKLGAPQVINLASELDNVPIIEVAEMQPQQQKEQPAAGVFKEVTNAAAPSPKKNNKPAKGVVDSSQLMGMHFDSLNFTGEWADFMQEPAKNMRIAIWGKPKNGKTAGATKLANYLTDFGNVLYNFADQGFNKSTKDLWKLSGLSEKPNAYAVATRELDELEELCASGKYQFIFIDMINTYIHRTGIKYFEFEDRFLKKFPNISFIIVFEVTKSGDFKGDQGWTHLVDAIVTVDSFVMENQGRYGVGHYVIWKEGLQKTNPKKYNEFVDEASDLTPIPTEIHLDI